MLRKMLPMLAMLVAGFMAKQHSGAAASESTPQAGGLGGMLGSLLGGRGGGSGLGAMLDMDGNGNPLDDILRMAGKALK